MADDIALCLRCRSTGHSFVDCTSADDANDEDWFFSTKRIATDLVSLPNESKSTICSRCKDLDLVTLLEARPPWKAQMEFSDTFEEPNDNVKKLGNVASAEFWRDCPICCCLFAITPTPVSEVQDIFLVPDWTISRLSGELGVVTMDTSEKQKYATCLLSVLQPRSAGTLPARIIAHRADALCLISDDIAPNSTLGGRHIDSTANIELVYDWISACSKRHDEACSPRAIKALHKIRLIDIETRTVVSYPGEGCDYIALSYVWGKVPMKNYRLGDKVQSLPQTLEDALSFTKKADKRYIWIDCVCIDQDDEKDKAEQINKMGNIYQGAWVTVIALSGNSADAGLSRIGRRRCQPQLKCQIGGKTLVSLMPTLSQQIWASPWGSRAWTLQEGLLSPRCLYISDHQMYYDCSSMQCCESLDDSKSWAHCLTPADNPTEEGFVTWMLRQGGAGALRVPIDWPSRRLEHWGEKLNLYSYRTMTYPEDAIRAFLGILQRLETIYPKGYFWGLPVEDMDWALTWASQMPPTRREGFPTWSWAGWQGPLFFGQPIDVKNTRRIPTFLKIRGIQNDAVADIFIANDELIVGQDRVGIVITNDPVYAAARQSLLDVDLRLDKHRKAEQSGYLFVTAICFNFHPDFSNPRRRLYAAGQLQIFDFTVKDVDCLIRIFSTDRHIRGKWVGDSWALEECDEANWTFILLARDHIQGFILHKLMAINMIDEGDNVAERLTILELLVPLDELAILGDFNPKKRHIILR